MKKTFAFNSMNADRKYNADDIAFDKAIFYSDGVVVQGGSVIGTQLKVEHIAGMQVKVNNGTAIIKGRTITFDGMADGSELVTLPQADLTKDRIDRVVLELNLTDAVRDIILKSIQGTPSNTPVAPALVRTGEIYQISLAQIRVIANSGTIGTITDERSDKTVCGISNVTVGIKPPTGNDAVTVSLSEETSKLYRLNLGNTNVDDALKKIAIESYSYSRYITFCSNLNANSLDAAFGKGYSGEAIGLGLALAKWAHEFSGVNKVGLPFTALKTCQNIVEIVNSPEALKEISLCNPLISFIKSSPFALTYFQPIFDRHPVALTSVTYSRTGSDFNISWVNPNTTKNTKVIVVFNASRMPLNPTDGTVVYSGSGTSATHPNVPALITNTGYYKVFTQNSFGEWYSGATAGMERAVPKRVHIYNRGDKCIPVSGDWAIGANDSIMASVFNADSWVLSGWVSGVTGKGKTYTTNNAFDASLYGNFCIDILKTGANYRTSITASGCTPAVAHTINSTQYPTETVLKVSMLDSVRTAAKGYIDIYTAESISVSLTIYEIFYEL